MVPAEDEDVSKELLRLFKKREIEVNLSVKDTKIEKNKDGVLVSFTDANGKPQTKQAEKVLVAVGRAPRTADIGLDKTKITPDRGFILTNEWMETTEPGVYAIGDIVAGLPQLAHVGSMAGLVVAARSADRQRRPHRGASEGKGLPGQDRQVPLRRQLQSDDPRCARRFRQGRRRREARRDSRRPHHWTLRHGDHRRGCHRDRA
jgi:NADPH-dependent 2,4-dienoyl-CoA reductase/sulfur reductase-like enzyme